MRVRKQEDCPEIVAGDGSRLRELVHPGRDYPFDGRYSLAHAVVAPGERTRVHRLKSDELYYILRGRGVMHVGEEMSPVEAGDVVEISPGLRQWIENTGSETLAFLCIVDPAWRAEDEEVFG